MQAGIPGTRLPDGSVIYTTAAAGNAVYRGHRLPSDLVGDYLHGEAVARSVRRLRPVKLEGLTQLRNVYPRREFIRSLDPLFRPVGIANAPDGTIYIADMYRGVIEGAPWAKEGTYLWQKIKQYKLNEVLGHGRVWRLTFDGMPPDRTAPRMLEETPAQLVRHLSHPNGWWRDTAQQLLVLRGDASVAPALTAIIRTSGNQLARYHALWALEGLGRMEPALARSLLKDAQPGMRIQAIRASETLYKAGDTSLAGDWRALAGGDEDTDVVIQALLTLNHLKVAGAREAAESARGRMKAAGIDLVVGRIVNPPAAANAVRMAGLTDGERIAIERGGTAYAESCFACHGEDGRGAPMPGGRGLRAPSLAGSSRVMAHRDYVVKVLLHGLTGPIDGRTYAEVMPPMGASADRWIADVASFIRNAFGNTAPVVTEGDVGRARKDTSGRERMWTADELLATLPRPLIPDGTWKATASHNPGAAAGAFDFSRWSTGVPQGPGMWFAVELPKPATLVELQFDSPPAGAHPTSPRAYKVETSSDGASWAAVAEGKASGRTTVVPFEPVVAKFVRITQTADAKEAPAWTMERLRLFEPAPTAGGGAK